MRIINDGVLLIELSMNIMVLTYKPHIANHRFLQKQRSSKIIYILFEENYIEVILSVLLQY